MLIKLLFLSFLYSIEAFNESFSEELLIKDIDSEKHYDMVPRALLQLLHRYKLDEFQLSLVKGYWDSGLWGNKFENAAPSGAELWAWFNSENKDIDGSWFQLTHALSGLFCASINRLGKTDQFASPRYTFRRQGLHNMTDDEDSESHPLLRYGQLPVPWSSAALLGGKLISLCPAAAFSRIFLLDSTNATSCQKPSNYRSRTVNFLPSPNSLLPLGTNLLASYSTSDLIKQGEDAAFICSSPSFGQSSTTRRISSNVLFTAPGGLIRVAKFATGSGSLVKGGIRAVVTNSANDQAFKLTYLDLLPWFVQMHLYTLTYQLIDLKTGTVREWPPGRFLHTATA